MLKRVMVIANPFSGKGQAEKYALILKSLLEKEYGSLVNIRLTEGEQDAYLWAKKASGIGFDSVICLGGDGTVNETVSGLMSNKIRPLFGFIPMGTVNDLGRALGYSMNPEQAIEQYKRLEKTSLDVIRVNDQYVVNVIAIGSIPESVMMTDSTDKNRFGKLAYVFDGISALFDSKRYHLKITTESGKIHRITTNLLLMCMTNSVAGYPIIRPKIKYNDGELFLIALKGYTPIDAVKAVFDSGILTNESQYILSFKGKKISIEAEEEGVITNVDGDPGPTLPIEVEVIHQALNICIPIDKQKYRIPFQ